MSGNPQHILFSQPSGQVQLTHRHWQQGKVITGFTTMSKYIFIIKLLKT